MLESYITCPLYANTSATHVMLLLDIINVFNSISRESVHHELRQHKPFAILLLLFDLLYNEANPCWFLTLSGPPFNNLKASPKGALSAPSLLQLSYTLSSYNQQ
jgi:hypothetical protein